MAEHAAAEAQARDQAARAYIQNTVGSGSTSSADELAKLADLKAQGVISDAEFEQAKAKALA
jgi:hypothetical protein